MKKKLLIIFFVLFVSDTYAEIADWSCYGSSSVDWYISSGEQVHGGTYSGKIANPSSGTYKILYQTVVINPSKTYSAEAWVYNINCTNTYYIRFRLGMHTDDSWNGNSFKTYIEQDTTTRNSWVKLRANNLAGGGTNNYAKVGLYISYPDVGNYTAYWDDIRLFATDNSNVNLLSNGDFESASSSGGGPEGGTVSDEKLSAKIIIDKKIFSPDIFERLKISFVLPYKDSDLLIRIYDINGNLIRDIYNSDEAKAVYPANTGIVYWDGRNDFGKVVRIGSYFIYIEAVNKYNGEVTRIKELVVVGKRLK